MIYVASKAKHFKTWQQYREAGLPIISTWIDEGEVGATTDWPGLWERCVYEASQAKALIVVSWPGETLKGAWIEVGAALSNEVPVFAVGCSQYSFRHHRLVTECRDIPEAFEQAMKVLQDG